MSHAPADPLPPERFEELLRREGGGFSLPPESTLLLARYLSELDHWRRRINLTGRLAADDLVRHTLEALVPMGLLRHGASFIDIGSGAGLPGVPLAIARPDLRVTLLEPRARRSAFLRHVVRSLPLANTAVLEARIENVGGQTFEVAATRAVGRLDQVVGDAPFLEPGGLLLLWTTDPGRRSRELPEFEVREALAITGSRRGVVAVFRKRG